MDSSPDILVEQVRAKRSAVESDLERLKVRTQAMEPRRVATKWGTRALPVAAGAAALLMWRRRRRSIDSLQDLLVHQLKGLYRDEQRMLPLLDRLGDAASNPDLATLFTSHREQTEAHRDRLDRILRSLGARPPRDGRPGAVDAIAEEGLRTLKRERDADVRDACLIAIAQRIEHLEIAVYGTARTFAQTLGHAEAAELLQQSLDDERAMDEQLTRLATRFVNPLAVG